MGYYHFVQHKNYETYVEWITNAGDVLVWWDANEYSVTPEPYQYNVNEHWSVDNTTYRLYRSDGAMENLDFIPKHDNSWNSSPRAAMTQSPQSDVIVTYFDSGRLESRVSVNGQWLETCSPLPTRLNARGEGLIRHINYFGIDHFWLPSPEVFSYNKPTALWRNARVLTLSDLLGPNVDAQQVGTLWDINDHGLIAANSPTHGPALLVPVDIAVDANRDGFIKFSGNHDQPSKIGKPLDKTTQDQPYIFWVNDDFDVGDKEKDSGTPDWQDGIIQCLRDLEDFSRMKIYVGGLREAFMQEKLKLGFEWKSVSGDPVIQIYPHVEPSGSDGYLKNINIAQRQIHSNNNYAFSDTTGNSLLNSASAKAFPGLSLSAATRDFGSDGMIHLLFEGCGEGSGQLCITIHDESGAKIGDGPGLWMDFKDVRKLYERGLSKPLDMIAPFDRNSDFNINNASVSVTGGTFQKPPDETPQCIIYIHGWNTDIEDYSRNCATMFKRLWHRGFKGRFAGFRWGTLIGGGSESFHVSEWRGYKFGKSLHDYVTNLKGRLPNYSINAVAHSLGSAALTVALDRGAAIDNCIYTQGALTAHVFDPDAPARFNPNPLASAPDLAADGGYRGWLAPSAVNVVNFYNEGDAVLNVLWTAVQNGKPHNASGPGQYRYTASTSRRWIEYSSGSLPTRDVFDNHESMAFVAIGRADALGAEEATGGAVDQRFNLGTGGLNYGGEHSSQFERQIQNNLLPYYNQMLLCFDITPNP